MERVAKELSARYLRNQVENFIMTKAFIRIWQEVDVEELNKHLLIIGELLGDCGNCKALGIDYSKHTSCPQCGTEFKYITLREGEAHNRERSGAIGRIKVRRPDLVFIDYGDFKRVTGKMKAREFFRK